jgi:uncharacterized protein (TIGR04255 family)
MADKISFENPPVIEVACGAVFTALEGFSMPYFGEFWNELKEDFPIAREVAPLGQQIERFGEDHTIELELTNRPPLPRIWFISGDEQSLIQIQRDRFHYNWKRPDHSVPYPTFENVYPTFEKYFHAFENFIQKRELGEIQLRQFELTYLNHIDAEMGLPEIGGGGGVLIDHELAHPTDRFLPIPASYKWETAYDMPDKRGRLYVKADSAIKSTDRSKVLRLDLTVRGVSKEKSHEARKDWFAEAHDWIVYGFADITNPTTQNEIWKRTS